MTLESYLSDEGIDPDADVESLSRSDAKERAVHTAYYRAVLSDSTYHGIDRGAKVDAVTTAVKSWPQFDHTDFREIDRAASELINERRRASA